MKETRFIMNMPVIVELVDQSATPEILDAVFAYFVYIDEKFSTFKDTSEISAINRGEIDPADYSEDMKKVFVLAEETRKQTKGYFNIRKPDGSLDTSGIVKGWAIFEAAKILEARGMKNFCVSVAGDMQVSGLNAEEKKWRVGIQNPFNDQQELVKILSLNNCGIATSGTAVRGNHIYNPTGEKTSMDEIISLTVVGPNVYEADRFATAAFAMGREGINFIENLNGLEGYLIDNAGIATMTTGFNQYLN